MDRGPGVLGRPRTPGGGQLCATHAQPRRSSTQTTASDRAKEGLQKGRVPRIALQSRAPCRWGGKIAVRTRGAQAKRLQRGQKDARALKMTQGLTPCVSSRYAYCSDYIRTFT